MRVKIRSKKGTKGAVESMKNLDNKGAKKYDIRYKIIKQRSRKVDNEDTDKIKIRLIKI